MLMSVCASSQDSEGKFIYTHYYRSYSFIVTLVPDVCIVVLGAFHVLGLVREAGLRVDCKLYTTLISTCGKSGKVYTMFDVWYLSFCFL